MKLKKKRWKILTTRLSLRKQKVRTRLRKTDLEEICNCKIHRLEFFRGSENQFHQGSERWKRPHPDLRLADVLTCINQ